jgi:hypothetical protein
MWYDAVVVRIEAVSQHWIIKLKEAPETQDLPYRGRDSSSRPPEYEAGTMKAFINSATVCSDHFTFAYLLKCKQTITIFTQMSWNIKA